MASTDWWTRPCRGTCNSTRQMPRGRTICLHCRPSEAPPRRAYRLLTLTNLRAVRLAQAVSQEELAKWSGLSLRTVHNAETGEHGTRPHTAEALAACLCVSVEELMA